MPRDPFVVAGIDITYTCTRDISQTRGAVHEIWADLHANALVITDDEGDLGAPTSSPTHRHLELRKPLTAAQITTIKQDLGHVLAGGPYPPEQAGGDDSNPLARGPRAEPALGHTRSHCTFALTASGSQDPFLHIAKDTATTQDAVTTLVRDLAP